MFILVWCFKQKTAYEWRSSDWSSDVCSSDLQAERLGAIVLRTVGPAQAAAGHHAEAQVNALYHGAVDEDLSQRLRLRQLFDRARVELEGAIGLLAAVARRLEEAGAQRRQNEDRKSVVQGKSVSYV